MDEIIKEELRAGEKVLWTGSPESFETLDVTNKQQIIKNPSLYVCQQNSLFEKCQACQNESASAGLFCFKTNKHSSFQNCAY